MYPDYYAFNPQKHMLSITTFNSTNIWVPLYLPYLTPNTIQYMYPPTTFHTSTSITATIKIILFSIFTAERQVLSIEI